MTVEEQSIRYQEGELQRISEVDAEDRAERIKSLFESRKALDISNESKAFLSSNLGRFILDRAIKEEEDATNQLRTIKISDFDDTTAFLLEINELQHRAHTPALIMTWIEGSILAAVEEGIIQHEKESLKDEPTY